jgi:HEAT repeat protein
MAIFGKSSADSQLRRLQTDPQLTSKEIADIIESVRFSAGFTVEENPWLFSHKQKKVREFAAQELRGITSKDFVDLLAKEMVENTGEIRRDIASVIIKVAPDRLIGLIAQLMRSTEEKERRAGLAVITRCPDPKQYLGHLKACLRDPETKIRQRAVRILGAEAQDPTVSLILRDLIHDPDDVIRHIVIEAVAKEPNGDIIEPFFHRLAHEGAETRAVMIRALRQVIKTSDRHIVEKEILPLLSDEDDSIRALAVKLLSELPDQLRVLRSFLKQMSGLAFWLRERSIESIQSVSDDLVPALMELIQEEDGEIRVSALQMARTVNDKRLFPAVRDLYLSDHDWWERSMAAEVLANFKGPEVTETILERADDPDLRYSVIPALGTQSDPAAIGALIECLKDPSKGIRGIAMRALEGKKTPEVIDAIRRAGMAEEDDDARALAAQVLRSLQVDDDVLFARLEGPSKESAAAAVGGLELEMANEGLNEEA